MAWDDKRGGRRSGGSGGFDKLPEIDLNKLTVPPIKPTYIAVGILALIVAYVILGGLYRVELQEQAVVLIMGKHAKTTGPGLHWNVPPPLGKIIKVRTEEIKRVEVGFRTGRGQIDGGMLKKEAMMLTEGANMIDIQMSVQYQIKDPFQFMFGVADTRRALEDRGLMETVKNIAEASLREVVGKTSIDNILTVGKQKVQQDVFELMQSMLDKYGAGLRVSLVQLQDVHPPNEVRDSFRDVNNAEEDKSRLIREAEGYRNSVIPEARGQVAQIIAGAEAYKAEKINRSKGDALRFEAQLFEYTKAPEITRKRLYLEMMESVLSKVEKIVIDPKVAKSALPILNLTPGRKIEIKEGN